MPHHDQSHRASRARRSRNRVRHSAQGNGNSAGSVDHRQNILANFHRDVIGRLHEYARIASEIQSLAYGHNQWDLCHEEEADIGQRISQLRRSSVSRTEQEQSLALLCGMRAAAKLPPLELYVLRSASAHQMALLLFNAANKTWNEC